MDDLTFLEDACYDSTILKVEVVQFPDFTMLLIGEQVCSVGLGNQITTTDVCSYVRSSFFAEKLCFGYQVAFDQVEAEISKKGMISALQSFNKKLSDKVFLEFLEHVALGFSINLENYLE